MADWVYVRSEPGLWTVGFYRPDGRWEPDTDHGNADEAAARVHYLNGGCTPAPATEPAPVLKPNPITGKPPVFCIDADCPSCGWAERTYDTATQLFGCAKCAYVSQERNS